MAELADSLAVASSHMGRAGQGLSPTGVSENLCKLTKAGERTNTMKALVNGV